MDLTSSFRFKRVTRKALKDLKMNTLLPCFAILADIQLARCGKMERIIT